MVRSILLGFLLTLAIPSVNASDKLEFNRDIRPILSNHCFACHGPDSVSREAGLRLDRRDAATQPAESGEIAVVPGDASSSELIRRITARDDDRMPPEGGTSLTAAQIETLKKWIEQGAEFQSHWAFIPPQSPAVPAVGSDWAKNNIDRFVYAKLQAEGRQPAPEASRETLIRRVAFDLTGLPPTLQEIDRYLADQSTGAYERMVDRYLKSPAYGEQMARHWLDLARYADSNGYQYDTEREQWVWRDWVIDAYNCNMPFDQFTIEQLAGDLLPNSTPQQRLATGFNRNHGITIEGGIIDEEYRTEYVMDRLVTTGEVWLGLTIGCARCHEHKFDPISQREFYELYAFFNQVPERGMRGFDPRERIPSPLAGAQHKQLKAELARLKAKLTEPLELDKLLARWTQQIAGDAADGWHVLRPERMRSTGGTTLTRLDDDSILTSGANPNRDIYEIAASTNRTGITAVRLEALTHRSLPGGGPGRHSNSNFVLSEFELEVVSKADPSSVRTIKFTRAVADYSQAGYEIAKSIDGTVEGNNGWAVDGPTRKLPAVAFFVAAEPFGFEGGTELRFRLRHEAGFRTHGIGRPRLSITGDSVETLELPGIPSEIRALAAKSSRTPDETKRLREYFLAHHNPSRHLRGRIAAIEQQIAAGVPATMIMRDMPKPRQTFVLNRGQYNEPLEAVSPGVPEIFPPLPDGVPPNRLGLARWLTDPRHPLTARVAVNRYWERLFGVGLVKTSEDFGVQGELPSHPELLDYLAIEFVRSGWNVKRMQRMIVTSATYRQTSHVGSAAYASDPENRLLARGPRLRLTAEEVRDAVLAVSGLLVDRIGGKSVYPYQPPGLWMELNNRPGYSKAYPQGKGADLYRRSLYTFWKRTVPSPMLKTFDAPEREFCTIRRSRTNTPLQALLTMNGPQFVEAARHLAQRMMLEGGESLEARIAYGFRLVTARQPSSAELALLRGQFETDLRRYADDEAAARRLLDVGDRPSDSRLEPSALAAYTGVARLLLNLDEAITKG